MKVITDAEGFVQCFAYVGDLVEGTEVPEPDDLDQFLHHFYAFRLADGKLLYDVEAYEKHLEQEMNEEYRIRREKECFSCVNRGQLWYATLSIAQIAELTAWYTAWLKVTETKVIPERPAWLE